MEAGKEQEGHDQSRSYAPGTDIPVCESLGTFLPVPLCHQAIAKVEQAVEMVGTGQEDDTWRQQRPQQGSYLQ